MDLFDGLKSKVKGKDIKVVFPEGNDARIIGAAVRLAADKLVKPILLGDPEEIHALGKKHGFVTSLVEVINPETYEDKQKLVDGFVERRAGKATLEQAEEMMKNYNYFGTMMT